MVKLRDGDEPQKVPLVYYDEDGTRTVVGEAAVQISNGEVIALGKLIGAMPNQFGFDELGLGGLSIPEYQPSPAEEASAKLGVLRKGRNEHVTHRNPSGEVKDCGRTSVHSSHEWRVYPADIFVVYCPGKSKS